MPYSTEICGIYKISFNIKVYIGSSLYCKLRRCQHLMNLRKQKHVNSHLQSAFNRYGESAFLFEILEEVKPELLKEREKYWINFFKSDDRMFGYNKIQVDREIYNLKKAHPISLGYQTGDAAAKNTKLNRLQVEKILRIYKQFKLKYTKKDLCLKIANYFNVSYSCIYDIVSERTWCRI